MIADLSSDESMGEADNNFDADDENFDELLDPNNNCDKYINPNFPGRLMVHKIEIENFKSYSGIRTIGPFHKGFSCVIGANGSGKSNVIDSMLFVFGYRAQKIRGQKLATLIHNSADHKESTSCRVTIFFQRIENIIIDPDAYEVIPEYNFTISRIAYKSGISSYMINKRECRFSDVKKELMSHGVDVDSSRFLILQGEVEHISIMKPKGLKENEVGLLEFLEELIGTKRYEKVLQRIMEKSENLSNFKIEKHNRARMAEQERNDLKAKRDKAIEYLEFENDIIRNRHLLTSWRLKECKENLEQVAGKYNKVKADLDKLDNEIHLLEDERNKKKNILNDIERKVVLREKKTARLKTNIDELENNEVADSKTLALNKTRLIELAPEILSDKIKMEECERHIDSNPDRLASLKIEFNDKVELIESAESVLAKAEKQLWTTTKDLRDRVSQLQQDQIAIVDERDNIKSQYDIALSNKSSTATQKKQAEEELEQAKNSYETANNALPSLIKSLKEHNESLKSSLLLEENVTNQMSDLISEERAKRNSLYKCQAELKEITENRSKLRNRSKILDFLYQCTEKGQLQGIYGRLGDLGSVIEKYDIAISTAGGRYLDFIVVDTMETAQKCVELLKTHRMGTASFLGLDKQQKWQSHINKDFHSPENVPRIFDVINISDEALKTAFYFAFRDTLIANDLDQATRVAYGSYRHRVVTLTGQLIETSGTLSGGGNAIRGRIGCGLNKRNSFGQDVQTVDMLKDQCAKIQREHDDIREQLDQARQKICSAKSQVNNNENKVKNIQNEIEANKHTSQINKVKYDRAQTKCKQFSETRMASYEEIEADIEKKKLAFDKISLIYNKIDEEAQSIKLQIKEKTDSELEIYRNTVRNHRLSLKQITSIINQLENEIKTSKRNLTKLQLKMEKNSEKEIELTKSIETLEHNLENTATIIKKLQNEYKECELSLTNIKSEFNVINDEVKDIISRIVEGQKGNIDIRDKVTRLSKQVQDNKYRYNDLQKQLELLKLNQIYDDYELIPFDENPSFDKIDVPKLSKLIEDRQKKHDQMKPDIDTIKLYEAKNKVYNERRRELDQLVQKIFNIREKHELIRKKRETEFMSAFDIIAKAVKSIYRELTFGGDADLELVDSMDPFAEGIEFSVRPPDKSWKQISNVSGGEKTLSSLALIFALHKYKPAPLYFMDEVDAALDYKNVGIVADFIKERTENAQFVVISLRLDMQDIADYLIGVYKSNNMSSSVTVNPRLIRINVPNITEAEEMCHQDSGSIVS